MLLLSDIMEKYRTMFMKNYQTELFSHYTINSLTWEVFKKYNHVEIKILSNYPMYRSFQHKVWGGICRIGSSRYAIANHKYMKNYNKNLLLSYIMHFDINSMYAYIMATYKLPCDQFSYLTDEEIRDFNMWSYDQNSEHGYILCIDISSINISHHDYFIDLPILPMKRKVYKKDISDYQKHIL